MISFVSTVTVNVSDQEKALDFFVNKLDFKVKTDVLMPNGFRWLEIATPQGETTVNLNKVEATETKENKYSGFLFQTPDIQATYQELTAKGVEFTAVPEQQGWGMWAEFKDSDGNLYGMSQMPS